jgi:RNA polymerase sigma-70 factor (ECF subfamily)
MTETRSSLLYRVRNPADAESWREFDSLYRPLLLGYAQSRGLAETDAHDVVQDVFIRLLKALPTFELDRRRGRFRTWLWQVTMSALIDWQRKAGQQPPPVGTLPDAPAPADREPEAAWCQAHKQRVLEYVLEQVRAESQPKTWACFEQRVLRGRTAADVAAELGLTANAVKVNASRVLARVRERCAEFEEDLTDD